MNSSRPNRKPDLTLTNLYTEEGNDWEIFYNFADAKDTTKVESWEIPTNSTFDPIIPIESGTAYAVWSEPIQEPYVTTKGKQRHRTRYDWVWIEKLEDYRFSTQTQSTKNAKERLLREAYHKMVEAQTNFGQLFEEVHRKPGVE